MIEAYDCPNALCPNKFDVPPKLGAPVSEKQKDNKNVEIVSNKSIIHN